MARRDLTKNSSKRPARLNQPRVARYDFVKKISRSGVTPSGFILQLPAAEAGSVAVDMKFTSRD
jgi:hypothetical protein